MYLSNSDTALRTLVKVVAVIPARYTSTRLPGKALVAIAGRPMVQHVWERAKLASSVSEVIVATDDERIVQAVEKFGGKAGMTRADHRSGTERVAEVAARGDGQIYVNVQGDEPLIDPAAIDAAVQILLDNDEVRVGTLATPIVIAKDVMDPNICKVVLDFEGDALYFSRAPVPWVRDTNSPVRAKHLKHLGIYVFRRDALLEFATFPYGELERIEHLEQLRWLENGFKIRVEEVPFDAISVDVPEDLARVEKLIQESAKAA
jgi:3-deoxy-manno-octulosonate cytidylyltransferase (CMP-KDO synthetase)